MAEWAIRSEKIVRDFASVRALDQVSLEIPSGIIFGFLGPNGAGKTTMIRVLIGLIEPTSGRAEVLGFDTRAESDDIRKRTGVLLEQPGLYERLSAEDNLEFFGRVWRIPSDERKGRIKQLLTHLGLWDRRKDLVKDWSRGMKQKLAVARTLLHRPTIIFLDEPTAGLDPLAAASLRDDLARLVSSEGTTVFLTTHNLVEAERLCGLVGVIRQGKLLTFGRPDELRRQSGGPRAEVIGRNFNVDLLAKLKAQPEVKGAAASNGRLEIMLREETGLAPLISLLVGAGAEIEEVRKGKASLEDVFLTLMEEDR